MTGGEAGALPLDVVFEILKNRRRRLALHYLHEHPGPVDIDDLSVHIAAVENGKSEREISAKERKRVYVGLYQWHLQKMADVGVIETDRKLNVELGPNAEQVYARLETAEAAGNGVRRYAAAALVGGVAIACGAVWPGEVASHLAVAVAIAVVLAAALVDAGVTEQRRATE
jgi:DNA-binding transcriptional ArsR family regulator